MRTKAEIERLIEQAKARMDYIEVGRLRAELRDTPQDVDPFDVFLGGDTTDIFKRLGALFDKYRGPK